MYVITAASGNTGKEIAEALLSAGKQVKVISRKAENVAALVEKGAIAAIGNVNDVTFMTETFKGATAVYTLTPPNFATSDWRKHIVEIGNAYALALAASGVKYVVNLSSQGAHLPEGAGPVSGLYYVEQALNSVPNLNVHHLRPGFFFANLYGSIGMIKHAGINGSSLKGDLKLPMVHTRDIAAKAVEKLLSLDFQGYSVAFVAGARDYSMNEVTAALGKAIGKEDLPYITFSREDEYNGMLQAGLSPVISQGYSDLYNALNFLDYQDGFTRTSENTTPTTLEDFLNQEFVYAFNA
jgi:uncharacterized protein YbjT (DUF2867 family)